MLKDDEEKYTVDTSEIADILSNHFEPVFVMESSSLPGFETRTQVCFGIERVLNKINKCVIEEAKKS